MRYDEIYSRFYELMTDTDFYKLSEDDAYSKMQIWLHNAIGKPYIRSLFSDITLNDEETTLTYTLNSPVGDDTDDDFIKNIFSTYMLISWMKPKIDDAINLAFIIGGKEEKSLRDNYKANKERLDSLELDLKKMIRDHGYRNGSYETT